MDEEIRMATLAETRRREATRSILKYGLLGFFVVAVVSTLLVFVIYEAGQRAAERRDRIAENNAVRLELCVELEKLKTQNRDDVAEAKKNYARNLRLLHLRDTPELRKAAEEGWARALRRNAPKHCPYRGDKQSAAAG